MTLGTENLMIEQQKLSFTARAENPHPLQVKRIPARKPAEHRSLWLTPAVQAKIDKAFETLQALARGKPKKNSDSPIFPCNPARICYMGGYE